MTTINSETVEIKFAIAEAAADLYVEGDNHFNIKDAAQKVGITPAEVFNYFPNKQAILQFYYTTIVFRYRLMIDEIEHFDSYTIGEKLSNFAYTTFDILDEKEAFVERTFKSLILCSYAKTDFEKEVETLMVDFLEDDNNLSVSSTTILNHYFYAFLRRQYLELIRFRLSDTSEGHELTMQLTDKLTNFLQELLYNRVLDQGFELGKFIYTNKETFIQQIPGVRELLSKIEIR
ncbi:TetR/AcrR family transcriptional regulator [Aliifodinibius salicampi]|uniref:TetR/AcrR family transcriptional regulator n=1 Tax=Fodinibius salicampi TaxID=1920655 RepID=A0ABT3Q2A7_9BACT|nr:TetR/AcrR family transcriptional regulator [Fodinibius salicampi]MCW9714221.1 TetR/AcrR family transcriptional regulator [Fodinibius salicampi]